MTNFFVTFSVPHLFQNDEKFYVVCENDEQAKEVARDAYSLDGVKNIRIRKCSKHVIDYLLTTKSIGNINGSNDAWSEIAVTGIDGRSGFVPHFGRGTAFFGTLAESGYFCIGEAVDSFELLLIVLEFPFVATGFFFGTRS